jgi:hypothetical protein
VTGTFVLLMAWSIKNRALARLRRLRQPRYLAALLLGLAYFYGVIGRHQLQAMRTGHTWLRPDLIATWGPNIVVAGGLVLWAAALLAWTLSSGKAWRFSGAEVQFLYTAPVLRRSLLHYKLLRAQVGVAFGVLMGSVFSGAAFARDSTRLAFLLGGWVLLSTMSLHATGVSLARARLRSAAGRASWQAWAPIALIVVLSCTLVADLTIRIATLPAGPLARTLAGALDVARTGLAGVALWPFMALVKPLTSPTPHDLLRSVAPALGLAALNYAWVIRADTAAADATLATEQLRARARSIAQPVVRPQPFALAASGRPEVAVLWKNLILLGRYASLATLLRVVPAFLIAAAIVAKRAGGGVVTLGALVVAAYAVVVGPMSMRVDLRHDMPRLLVLKTWPVRGASLVAGELAAPALVLTLVAWAALAVALSGSGAVEDLSWALAQRAVIAFALGLLAPALIVLQLLMQNAAVILLPGWVPTGSERPRGIEAMGQNLLVFAGTALAFGVGLLPGMVIGGGIGAAVYMTLGFIGVPVAAAVTTIVLSAEIAVAVFFLGRVLERTDPAHVETAD